MLSVKIVVVMSVEEPREQWRQRINSKYLLLLNGNGNGNGNDNERASYSSVKRKIREKRFLLRRWPFLSLDEQNGLKDSNDSFYNMIHAMIRTISELLGEIDSKNTYEKEEGYEENCVDILLRAEIADRRSNIEKGYNIYEAIEDLKIR